MSLTHETLSPTSPGLSDESPAGSQLNSPPGQPGKAASTTSQPAGSLVSPRVVGVDLSLTSTGVATATGVDTINSRGHRADTIQCRYERMRFIRLAVLAWCSNADLVVIEGPSFHSNNAGTFDRSGLWWQLVGTLLMRGTAVAVVPPQSRAKYATGRGNAPKDAVLTHAVKRFPNVDVSNNNEADALWLCAMGHDHLGCPLVVMPDVNRSALAKIAWPETAAV